jgi:hypothetical protein
VLISRCGWHSRNYGYDKILGVRSWRGVGIEFTDGICRKCATRAYAARQNFPDGLPRASGGGGQTSEIVVVGLAVLTGLVLIARPANEGSTRVEVADLMPRSLTIVHATSVEPSPSGPRVRRPRPARPTTSDYRAPRIRETTQSP